MADQNTFMLDGGNNTSDLDGDNATYVGHNGAGVMPTPVESVEEFRVNTNNMTADFSMLRRRPDDGHHQARHQPVSWLRLRL